MGTGSGLPMPVPIFSALSAAPTGKIPSSYGRDYSNGRRIGLASSCSITSIVST